MKKRYILLLFTICSLFCFVLGSSMINNTKNKVTEDYFSAEADSILTYGELIESYPKYSYSYDGSVMPSDYCLKDEYMIYVSNQGAQGLCWDFATSLSLTTTISKATNQYLDFSEGWISTALTYGLKNEIFPQYALAFSNSYLPGGGGYPIGFDLIAKNYGLVLEQDFTYEESFDCSKENVEHLYEYYSSFANKNIMNNVKGGILDNYVTNSDASEREYFKNAIKYHILNHGGVYAGLTWSAPQAYTYKNSTIYCKTPSNGVDGHGVCIIGWDDNVSATIDGITYTGAWVTLNSHGNDSQNEGVFYIFYNDSNLYRFFGYVYEENESKEIYFNTTLSSNGTYSTDLAGAYSGDFIASTKQTKQQNIFYNIDDINLSYSYDISKDTQIDSVRIYDYNGVDVTLGFNINIDSKISISANDLDLGAYKVVFTCSKGKIVKEFLSSFYLVNGTEINYTYMQKNEGLVSNYGRYQLNNNNLSFAPDEIVTATTQSVGEVYIYMTFASYNKVTNIETSFGVETSKSSTHSYVIYIDYDLNKSNTYSFEIVSSLPSYRTVVVKIDLISATDTYANVNYDLGGGAYVNLNKKLVLSESQPAQLNIPSRNGYVFGGWYYDKEFSDVVNCKDGIYYVENDKVIEYDTNTVFWQTTFDDYYQKIEIIFLYAKWENSTFNITSSSGENGTISEVGVITVNNGSNKTFVFTANEGYLIKDVYIDGKVIDLCESYTFENIKSDHTIYVTFRKIMITLTFEILGEGSIDSQNNLNEIYYGDNIVINLNAEKGWKVSEVYINGTIIEKPENILTLNNVQEDLSIKVVFKEKTSLVTKILTISLIVVTGVMLICSICVSLNRKKRFLKK